MFNFKADPKNARVLTKGSIDAVTLANNHILDYAEEGLRETLETLDHIRVGHVGAGATWQQATKPLIVEKKGVKIGILGCTDNEPAWKATETRPGIFYLNVGERDVIKEFILKLRPQVDIVILSIHWGPNMQEKPSQDFKQFAHHLIDLGVDIIHGHSAHLFQGVEVYKNKLIFYDMGDFIDDYAVDPVLRNDLSFFFIVEIKEKKISGVRLIPGEISHFQANRTHGEENIPRMKELSKEFGTLLLEENGELFIKF